MPFLRADPASVLRGFYPIRADCARFVEVRRRYEFVCGDNYLARLLAFAHLSSASPEDASPVVLPRQAVVHPSAVGRRDIHFGFGNKVVHMTTCQSRSLLEHFELSARQRRHLPMVREDDGEEASAYDAVQGPPSPSASEFESAFRTEDDAKRFSIYLEEKQKDLELAAKIGKSLLDQNKELRERNEFLEESLTQSNDTVVQLKHQLQQRSDLLATMCSLGEDYYNEEEAARSDVAVQSLQKRLRQLESDNETLKQEAKTLKEFTCEMETQSHTKITEYMRMLEAANFKISKLHSQINDKNQECVTQATEIRQLVKEIQQRKASEKALANATTDLHQQLTQAVSAHDNLKSEILVLQEVYTEVRGRLSEAQEELGIYRLRAPPHRTGSSDSLYDSLASELEANDSGFFNTPMISARTDSGQSSSDYHSPGSCAAVSSEPETFEVPSKVLIDSVRRNNRRLREKSPSLAEELLPAGSTVAEPLVPELEAIKELQTPMAEASNSLLAIQEPVPAFRRTQSTESDPEDPECQEIEECIELAQPSTSQKAVQMETAPMAAPVALKTFRDSSCSPIAALLESCSHQHPRTRAQTDSSASLQEDETASTSGAVCDDTESDEESTPRVLSGVDPSAAAHLQKSDSNDSLNRYDGPRLGEPGQPGTRDLEYSLRKLRLRKQIELDYQRFRQARGLPPSTFGFYHYAPTPNVRPQRLCGPLSSQLEYLSSTPEQTGPTVLKRLFDPVPKTLVALGRQCQSWQQRSSVGLTAAIGDPSEQGVVQRASVSPPETPQSKSAGCTPKRISLAPRNRSPLFTALGLNTLAAEGEGEERACRPNALSIFRSPLLLGNFQADRELSPPFGGSPSQQHEGLDLIHTSSTAI